MKMLKKLATLVAITILGFVLTACGKTPEPVVHVQKVAVPTAEELGLRAKAEIASVARATARKYLLRDEKGCEPATSAPPELLILKSYNDFRITGPGIYRAACIAEIKLMTKERQQVKAQGVAEDKAHKARFAAAKARAEQQAAAKHRQIKSATARPADKQRR